MVVAAVAKGNKTKGNKADLRSIVEHTKPVSLSVERCLPVLGELQGLFPAGGLQRGSVVELGGGPGITTLAMALLAGATKTGSWVATVGFEQVGGFEQIGWEAAEDLGVNLQHLAAVRCPARKWPTVVASLVESFDLVLCGPEVIPGAADLRRLRTRIRERGSVLMAIPHGWGSVAASGFRSSSSKARGWHGSDIRLEIRECHWWGLGNGWGNLAERRLKVAVDGRGSMNRQRVFEIDFDSRGRIMKSRIKNSQSNSQSVAGSHLVSDPPLVQDRSDVPAVVGPAGLDRVG